MVKMRLGMLVESFAQCEQILSTSNCRTLAWWPTPEIPARKRWMGGAKFKFRGIHKANLFALSVSFFVCLFQTR